MTPALPCVTCATPERDCGTCSDYGAWLAVAHPEPVECATCVDVGWLTLSGEQFDQIAARMGILRDSLIQHLKRHDRRDLIPRRTA